MGHSAATIERHVPVTRPAGSTTHLFNAMSGVDHRAPGLAVAALLDDAAYAELIADGIHVDPALWPLIPRLKPADRLVLVSDAISLAGMGDGRARIGGLEVEVVGQRVTLLGTTTLAGSVIALDDAVRNLVAPASCCRSPPPPRAANPLALLGIADRGRIAVGQRADLVELDDDLHVRRVMRGRHLARCPVTRLELRALRRPDDPRDILAASGRPCSPPDTGSSERPPEPASSHPSSRIRRAATAESSPLPPPTRRLRVGGATRRRPSSATCSARHDPPTWGPNMWVEGAGHAVADAEIIRDLYGPRRRAGSRGRDQPLRPRASHGPGAGRRLVPGSASGMQHVHAIREVPGPRPVPARGLIDPSRRTSRHPDLGRLDVAPPSTRPLSPVFSRVGPPPSRTRWPSTRTVRRSGHSRRSWPSTRAASSAPRSAARSRCPPSTGGIVRPAVRRFPRVRRNPARCARPGCWPGARRGRPGLGARRGSPYGGDRLARDEPPIEPDLAATRLPTDLPAPVRAIA